ncbi:MAG: UDP-N-acetylglucosamine 2-epimerase (non-hydrolyzing) [Planctomycetota bacterium]
MRILNVVGARPNFMKIAPLARALSGAGIEQYLVHTGQHYDANMSKVFFDDLGLPKPDVYLGIGSGSHAQQTAKVMEAFEPVLLDWKPDLVVVVGDVNSTVACSLDAAKLGIAVAHVEAGLRSYDWSMPEEINRVVTDRLAALLLTPSADGDENLAKEGVAPERIHRVGNIMIDSLVQHLPRARQTDVAGRLGLKAQGYAVLTLHRPSNVDDPEVLFRIMGAVERISRRIPVVFSCHPRTAARLEETGAGTGGDIRRLDPLGYHEFLGLMADSRLVLTDSGGLQEETTYLGIPCVTIRENTERPITINEGTNSLAGTDAARIEELATSALEGETTGRIPDLWDGKTADRIVKVFRDWFNNRS